MHIDKSKETYGWVRYNTHGSQGKLTRYACSYTDWTLYVHVVHDSREA